MVPYSTSQKWIRDVAICFSGLFPFLQRVIPSEQSQTKVIPVMHYTTTHISPEEQEYNHAEIRSRQCVNVRWWSTLKVCTNYFTADQLECFSSEPWCPHHCPTQSETPEEDKQVKQADKTSGEMLDSSSEPASGWTGSDVTLMFF